MTFQIPKRVKVGGLIYQVKIVDKIGGEDCSGLIDGNKLIISIEKADIDAMNEVFLHEIFHAMNMEWPEERTESTAMQMYQVLVDNKGIFDYGKK